MTRQSIKGAASTGSSQQGLPHKRRSRDDEHHSSEFEKSLTADGGRVEKQAMTQLFLKTVLSAVLLVGASEAAKRSPLVGAMMISLPLASILALSFLWTDTHDPVKVMELAKGIALMILPSVVFFIALVALLKLNHPYWLALGLSCATMVAAFAGYAKLLSLFGLKI